jgi:hypothetical protein
MTARVTALRIVFGANILIEGAAGIWGLYEPIAASQFLFGSAVSAISMRMLASVWLACAILSIFGLSRAVRFSVVLVVQLVYKGIWVAAVALPAIVRFDIDTLPGAITFFAFTWVAVLPFIIPWRFLIQSR